MSEERPKRRLPGRFIEHGPSAGIIRVYAGRRSVGPTKFEPTGEVLYVGAERRVKEASDVIDFDAKGSHEFGQLWYTANRAAANVLYRAHGETGPAQMAEIIYRVLSAARR